MWVRETYCELPVKPDGSDSGSHTYLYYKADGDQRPEDYRDQRWFPAIHMPKGACRTFLRVTDVRVERVQDISAADAIAEGIDTIDPGQTDMVEAVRNAYKVTWDATLKNDNRDRLCWDANPYVWVYEFEQIKQPEDWVNYPRPTTNVSRTGLERRKRF